MLDSRHNLGGVGKTGHILCVVIAPTTKEARTTNHKKAGAVWIESCQF